MEERLVYTRAEVAKLLGVSERTLRRRVPPDFAWVRIGSKVMLQKERVPELLKALEWAPPRIARMERVRHVWRRSDHLDAKTAQERVRELLARRPKVAGGNPDRRKKRP